MKLGSNFAQNAYVNICTVLLTDNWRAMRHRLTLFPRLRLEDLGI